MFLTAKVTTYDLLDSVSVYCQIWTVDPDDHSTELVGAIGTTFKGIGEDDPYKWLETALQRLLSSL